jgi:hypothetical protein
VTSAAVRLTIAPLALSPAPPKTDPKQTDSSPKSGAVGGFVAGVATDLVGVDRGDLTAALADVQGKEVRPLSTPLTPVLGDY